MRNRKIPTSILNYIVTSNDINGGFIMPQVATQTSDEMMEVTIHLPSISPENVVVDIVETEVIVLLIKDHAELDSSMVILKQIDLPSNAMRDLITAHRIENGIAINIPLTEKDPLFYKRISIQE